jgi:site-specific recombinase XerD
MNIGSYIKLYSEDLRLKNYAKSSIENYCSQVTLFLKGHEQVATKPSEINERQIKEWLLKAKTTNSMKHRLSAVKLFYKYTGKQPMKFKYIEYPRADKKLPIVLSIGEIQKLFNVCDNLKHKSILSLLYSCGLRVSEVINLKLSNIDSSRMVINIIAAKGNKDRQVPLNQNVLGLLRRYFLEYKPKEYLFNGQKELQYSSRSVLELVKSLSEKAKLNKRVYTHLIRHCSFTHMAEAKVDINIIQRLAGHQNVKTTALYLHLSHNLISQTYSPIQSIKL